jgi:hypothetical protein
VVSGRNFGVQQDAIQVRVGEALCEQPVLLPGRLDIACLAPLNAAASAITVTVAGIPSVNTLLFFYDGTCALCASVGVIAR